MDAADAAFQRRHKVGAGTSKVAMVLEKGSTSITCPMVTCPAGMPERMPPPFWMAIRVPCSLVAHSMASAIRLPRLHSPNRQASLVPTSSTKAVPTGWRRSCALF
jgi:hypothetical protein